MANEIPRPCVHYTAPRNWMNDPNGLVFHDGTYHMYYQHNPFGTEWGHMSWGHAVSRDLFHWRDLPLALAEDKDARIWRFSGTALVDHENASGLAEDDGQPLVIAYTGVHREPDNTQDIHIAWSTDSGMTFREFDDNPVLAIESHKFGDPRLMRHGGRWVLVSIEGAPQGRVLFHASDDLHKWEQTGEYANPGDMPSVWECPDLFRLPVEGEPDVRHWVLKVNTTRKHETYYIVGDFDGATFRPMEDPLLCNHGDAYAEQTYALPASDDRCILVAWIRQPPMEGRPWTGMMSVPCELRLRRTADGFRLLQEPARELADQHLPACWHVAERLVDGRGCPLPGVEGAALDLDLAYEVGEASAVELVAGAGTETVSIGCSSDGLYVDRQGAERVLATLPEIQSPLRLRVVLDRGIVEAFAQDGLATLAVLVKPADRFSDLRLRSHGGGARLLSADAWPLPDCMQR